jgi:hypothetical protein
MAKRERAPNDSLPDPVPVGASPAHRETATAKSRRDRVTARYPSILQYYLFKTDMDSMHYELGKPAWSGLRSCPTPWTTYRSFRNFPFQPS